MPVDEDVNLNQPLSAEDLKQLDREAKLMEKAVAKMEKEAIKAEKAKLKIGKTVKEINQLASHNSPMGDTGDFTERTTSGFIGTPHGRQTGGAMPLGRQGMTAGEQVDRSPMGREEEDHKKFLQELKLVQALHAKEMAEAKKERDHNEKMIKDMKGIQGEVSKIESTGMGLMHNPRGLALSKVKGLLGKSVYGAIAVMVFELGEKIFNDIMKEVKGLFKEGGIYDIRKLVVDEVHYINSLDHILKMEEGMIYFSSNSSEVLRQGPSTNSNTRDLEFGHKQFLRLNNQ
jgi:hypothetical protein|tara:strand:+ start:1907 stop:2767 length:861 start_codon:yes stop_codon:yes gene_type:complete